MKIIVISFPKSGTYLISKLLELIGLTPTHWHIGIDRYSDYANSDIEHAQKNPRGFDVVSHFTSTIQNIPDNTFSVSHLPFSSAVNLHLKSFKKIILVRNPYECLCSQMMWEYSTKRYASRKKTFQWPKQKDQQKMLKHFYLETGQKYIKKYLKLLPWLELNNTLIINYDLMTSLDQSTIEAINSFLKFKHLNSLIVKEALKEAIATKTLTKSSVKFPILNYPDHIIFKDTNLKMVDDRIKQLAFGIQ